MAPSFRPAEMSGVAPLIALYGESGSGKTYSALMLARGLVGSNGRIAMIDTESGRGGLYADVIDGGYDLARLDPPFTPAAYVEAIQAAEGAGYDVIVVDSMSHEWEGQGGVLDQAAENEARSGKPGLHCWKKPKAAHNSLMLSLLRARTPVICCLRAKYRSRQGKDRNGKTTILKDDHMTPIQSEDFIFEMTAHMAVERNHKITPTKLSHPRLKDVFPTGIPIDYATGERLAAWMKMRPQGGAGGDTGHQAQIDPEALEDALRPARDAARQGSAALKAHVDGASEADKAILRQHWAELKTTAQEADADS